MDETESLSHTKWEHKCHVFIPKCRRKRLYGEVRRAFGRAAAQVGGAERESNRRRVPAARSHVLMIAIPPKYGGSQVIGFVKGKRAIHLTRV